MLLIKKEYYPAIRAGAKTATLRYWRAARVRPGRLIRVRGLGALRIESVRQVDLGELGDADVRADGFEDISALRLALRRHYPPGKREGRSLYQVRFTYLGEAPPA